MGQNPQACAGARFCGSSFFLNYPIERRARAGKSLGEFFSKPCGKNEKLIFASTKNILRLRRKFFVFPLQFFPSPLIYEARTAQKTVSPHEKIAFAPPRAC